MVCRRFKPASRARGGGLTGARQWRIVPVVGFGWAGPQLVAPTHFAGVPLPLDLSPFGMAGCELLTSCDAVLPLVISGGGAAWSTPVCACSGALGRELYLQAAAIDAGANAAGVVWTAGLTAVLGAR